VLHATLCARWFFVGLVISTVFFCTASSNDRLNIRGAGMAGASVAVARGLDAVEVNPANLSLSDGGILTFTLLPVGASVSSDLFTYDFYSTYFKNRKSFTDLPDQDKRFILNSFASSVSNSQTDISTRLFGASLRIDARNAIAFAVDYRLVAGINIPKEYLRLLMYGNVRNSSFVFENAAAQAFWARTYSLSYGTTVPAPSFLSWLSAGVGLKLVQGYGYYETEQLGASLQTGYAELLSGRVYWHARTAGPDRFSKAFNELFQTPLGYGVAVDLGISGGLNEYLSFGLSLTDIGGIRWSEEVEKYSLDQQVFEFEPRSFNTIAALERKFSDLKIKGGAFTSPLPGLVRAGLSIQVDKAIAEPIFPGSLLLAVEYTQGVGADTPLRVKRCVSFGAEYRPLKWLPIRSGFALQSNRRAAVSFGLGLNFRGFDFDLGTENILAIFNPRTSTNGSLGVGMHFRIPMNYVAI
jgi:hypothetical protein